MTLTNLARAIALTEWRRQNDGHGAALAAQRSRLAGALQPQERVNQAATEATRINALQIEDMPPSADDIALLLDTVSFNLDGASRAEAWRSIGVNPNRGRDLLARSHSAFDWPIWFTLCAAALGPEHR